MKYNHRQSLNNLRYVLQNGDTVGSDKEPTVSDILLHNVRDILYIYEKTYSTPDLESFIDSPAQFVGEIGRYMNRCVMHLKYKDISREMGVGITRISNLLNYSPTYEFKTIVRFLAAVKVCMGDHHNLIVDPNEFCDHIRSITLNAVVHIPKQDLCCLMNIELKHLNFMLKDTNGWTLGRVRRLLQARVDYNNR